METTLKYTFSPVPIIESSPQSSHLLSFRLTGMCAYVELDLREKTRLDPTFGLSSQENHPVS